MSMAPASSSDLRSTAPNAIASNIVDSGNLTHDQISSQAANPAACMPLFPKTITTLRLCTIVYLKNMLCRMAQCTAFQQHWRSMHPWAAFSILHILLTQCYRITFASFYSTASHTSSQELRCSPFFLRTGTCSRPTIESRR